MSRARTRSSILAAAWGGVVLACAPDAREVGLRALDTEGLSANIERLASDEFEGRAPSSPGEERTIAFLQDRYRAYGLEPVGNTDFLQPVPLVALTVQGTPALTVRGRGGVEQLAFGRDAVVWTKRVVESVTLDNSELVFVGYGIVAPEYEWDDYEGLDVQGKTVVMLVNDPGFATQDSSLFTGNAMTYYGRWTYKFEEAARKGAAGALIIHRPEPAGYPWEVVKSSWTGPQFDLARADDNMSRVVVEGWIAESAAEAMFARVGRDLAALTTAAAERGFQPVPLGLRANVALTNTVERSASNNVIGMVRGREAPDEYVIYTAHWDHFGRDPDLEGDQIYNGALDNATGTGGLLELAEAFSQLDPAPARSVVFLAVTAEEQGLLGSAYYADNPVVPPRQTVAVINMDGLNIHGPMRDVTVVGYGKSELDDYVERAAAEQGRRVRPDPEPEKGFYYRSDHFSFAKVGIPAIYTDAGIDHVEHGEEWTLARRDEYTAQNYHKPSDEFDPSWDLTGAIDDLRLLFTVGFELATSDATPNWREGTEFKAARDADLASSSSDR